MDIEQAVRILNGEELTTPEQMLKATSMAVKAFCGAKPMVRCKDCMFWNRKHISREGYARCIEGESGLRYRRDTDFCSRAERIKESEDKG